MSIVNINGRKIDIEGYDTMSPEEQQSAQDEITGQLGQHEQAAQELNQQQKETAEPSWQQNPYIAGPVSAAVDTATKAYEHPLAAAGVATALGTAGSKIPVVGPAVGNALRKVAGAFVPQKVQDAATGLSNLAEGANQWAQQYAARTAQQGAGSLMDTYNTLSHQATQYMKAGQAVPQHIQDMLNHVGSQIRNAPANVPTTTVPVPTSSMPTINPTETTTVAQQAAAVTGPASGEGATFLQRLGQQFGGMAQRVAPVLNNPAVRTAGQLGSVGGQFATYSPGLNTNEEAELARRRGMGATIKPFGQ